MFFPPDTLQLDLALEDWQVSADRFLIVNYTTPHEDLDTIESDFYNLCFKKMCLGQVQVWLAAMRSKYEGLSTPFGQINLDWQRLQQEGQQKLEEANQFLAAIPPHTLLEVF